MFDWHAWIDLADALLNAPSADEAHWRCAVSRAYYAVFNLNHERLLSSGRIDDRAESIHFAVWKVLSTSADRDERRLAIAGKRLQGARVGADYLAHIRFTVEDSRHWVDLARRLVAETNGLSA